MKIPLRYQITEYDCGPTSLLNAVTFLFEREQIPPDVPRNIMLYCMDQYGPGGVPGTSGTSAAAMTFLSNWLTGYGKMGGFPITARYLCGDQVCLGPTSLVSDALRRGGVAVVRVLYDEGHYVLLTRERDGLVYLFDPYYRTHAFSDPNVRLDLGIASRYNRVVPVEYFNREDGLYAFGEKALREAVLLFNKETRLTPEATIEYMI